MPLKKIIGKLHLWLGVTSGLIVFIIAITGCIYAFQEEIQSLTQPYRYVEAQNKAFLPPSRIREITDAQLPGKHIHGIMYQGKEQSAKAIYFSFEDNYYDFVYVNPYMGEVLKVKDEYQDFFRIVLDGHFYLWLPPEIGQPVIATTTLIFVVMLISGLFLWWPRNKNGARQRFSIKWNARWRRKNYDLHNVLGFYISGIALILALTGLTWGFEWFKAAVYKTAGGEKSLVYSEPPSDTTALAATDTQAAMSAGANPVDLLWRKMQVRYPEAESIEMHFPESELSPIHVAVNPDASTYWEIDYLYFDQYTLAEIQGDNIWDRFDNASSADKLMRLNYDIHTGAIMGLPGKILAFFASLLCASLPVTGFVMWYGRRKKAPKITKQVLPSAGTPAVLLKRQKI
ncbi:PepSY domain-containing protein [Pontibacter diazotrophicus]|uniref:PepSY domain-containing protein n=1 Tax=Pontibacter diazotrophicus TaxID=1400979 RepID=A0A3D8LA92_9BACT|nr:PepSY-associated TM helix domain-containing protein [Pontibacter diazotrophicus]RDV14263.1 PepSY domain-containing protein [Pontibacter diazotrophicus]